MAEMIWNAAVSVYNFIMDNIVLINIFLALVIVFFQRRSPQTVWTWLLLLYFILFPAFCQCKVSVCFVCVCGWLCGQIAKPYSAAERMLHWKGAKTWPS